MKKGRPVIRCSFGFTGGLLSLALEFCGIRANWDDKTRYPIPVVGRFYLNVLTAGFFTWFREPHLMTGPEANFGRGQAVLVSGVLHASPAEFTMPTDTSSNPLTRIKHEN